MVIEYQTVAVALGGVTLGLLAVIWGQVSSKLDHMAETLNEVARRVHGHQIEIDYLKGARNAE